MKLSTSALALALAASFGLTSLAFAQTNSTPAAPAPAASATKTDKADKADKSHKTVQHKTRTDKSSADAKSGAGEAVKK